MTVGGLCRIARAAVLSLLVCVPALAAGTDAQSGYEVGPKDKLMIRVGQWLDSDGTYRGWEDVSGEYSVSAAGTLSLPLIGTVTVAGKTPDQIASEIGSAFDAQIGLGDRVVASVEVSEYRPVFITGAVNRPGAFPWQPGLTVMQAIGLAGGLVKTDSVFIGSERNALTALGDYEVYRLRLWRNLATEARLEAELAGSDAIEMPDRLKNAPMADALIKSESEIMDARAHALSSSIKQLESLERLLEQQIDSLGQQIELRKRQVKLAKEELGDVTALMEKGLTVQSRQNSIERTVADLESRELDLETAKLEAQQSLNKAQRDKADLLNEHRREIVTNLAETRANVAELEARIETERGLYAEASRLGTGEFRLRGVGTPIFMVRHPQANSSTEPEIVEATASLRPGDVLDVQASGLESLPVAPAGSIDPEAQAAMAGRNRLEEGETPQARPRALTQPTPAQPLAGGS